MRPRITTWTFWLADDPGPGTTDHSYALRLVAAANGGKAEIAWQPALRCDGTDLGVPEGFGLPETLIAIRGDHQLRFRAGARRGSVIARTRSSESATTFDGLRRASATHADHRAGR